MVKLKYIGLIIIVALSLESCAYLNTFYNAKSAFNEGYNTYLSNQRQGREGGAILYDSFQDAITKSQKILNQYENSQYVDNAYLLIAKSYYYTRQYNRTRDYLNLLIGEYPDSPLLDEAHLYLGMAYTELEKYVLARQELNRVLNSNAKSKMKVQAYLALADLSEIESDYQGMMEAIDAVIQISGDDEIKADAAWQTARWASENGQYARAESYYKEARQFTRIPSFDRRIDFEMTQLYRRMGEYDLARDEISVMLANEEFEDLWPELEVERGLLYEIMEDTSRAVQAYQYVTTNHNRTPAGARAHYLLGEIFYERMEYADARESFRQVSMSDRESSYIESARERMRVIDRLQAVRKQRVAFEELFTEKYNTYQEVVSNSGSVAPQTSETESKNSAGSMQSELGTMSSGMLDWIADNDTLAQKAEYVEILYQEAELYIFEIHRPEHGIEILDNITTITSDEELVAKTYLLKTYTYENVLDRPGLAADYREKLAQEYSGTQAARSLNAGPDDTIESLRVFSSEYLEAKALYKRADTLIASQQFRQALPVLREASRRYPDTEYGAKALFTVGWIWDESLHNLDSALVAYEQFQQRYPDHIRSEEVASRLNQLNNIQSYLVQETNAAAETEEQPVEPEPDAVRRVPDPEQIRREVEPEQNQQPDSLRQLPELR